MGIALQTDPDDLKTHNITHYDVNPLVALYSELINVKKYKTSLRINF